MSNRLWSSAPNDNRTAPSLPYIYDPNAVNNGVVPPITGNWRPYCTTDIGSVSISGLSITSVAVTGGSIAISNPVLAVTGALSASINAVAVTGNPNVTIDTGSFLPSFSAITNGQMQIPVGARQYSVAVESGSAYINGMLINAQTIINGGGYDGRRTLSSAINVGCTGGRIIVTYET